VGCQERQRGEFEEGHTMNVLEAVTQNYLREDVPDIRVGDTVKVHIKIVEGSRERIQVFEGYVLKMQGGGIGQTFTVRRVASGIGVEKTFPVHSPRIDRIEVTKHGFVRRAKLNYMRKRTGKSAKMRAEKE
jgi:large subunit ribosomal protein L19